MALIQCKECGATVSDLAESCPKCGAPIAKKPSVEQQQPAYPPTQPAYQTVDPLDTPNTGLNVLSFFFPIIGLILYFVYRDQTPNKAKDFAKYACIGFAVFLLFYFIF